MAIIPLFSQNWLLFSIVIILIIFLLSRVLRWFIRFVFISAILAFILVFIFGISKNQVALYSQQALQAVKQVYQNTFHELISHELAHATYHLNQDGTYTIQTKHFSIEGITGGEQAKITYQGHSYTINMKPYADMIQHLALQIQQ